MRRAVFSASNVVPTGALSAGGIGHIGHPSEAWSTVLVRDTHVLSGPTTSCTFVTGIALATGDARPPPHSIGTRHRPLPTAGYGALTSLFGA